MARLFWLWLAYSFFGYLLERVFALIVRAENQDRKCFLILPLCPVHGLGALAILSLPQQVRSHPIALFLYGALAATAVEYAVDAFYEKALHVRFWDYTHLPANLNGRVCLLFSSFWGVLSLVVSGLIQPLMEHLPVPTPLLPVLALPIAADALVTSVLLRRHRTPAVLCWYHSSGRESA